MKKLLFILILFIFCLQSIALSEAVVQIYYFYSPTCLSCLSVREFVETLQKKYPLEVKYFNIDIRKNYETLIFLEQQYNVKKSDVSEIFIGDSALVGKRQINADLEDQIKNLLAQGGSAWPDQVESRTKGLIEERFKTFTLFTVLFAGLIDGINPCAFATIVFFVSFLSFVGRRKREILVIGSFFTAAVFLTYLLIGFGIFRFLQTLEIPFLVSKNIYYAIGIIALALGILNLYDYYRFKKGMLSKMTLQLPGVVKRMIHAVIRVNKATSGTLLIATAAATGFLVSILESICTGQVYLPTIVFILKTQGLRTQALSFLVLYNLMFIFPLVLIFGLTLFGATSEWFGKIMNKNLGATKILLALLLFALGISLIII